MHKSKHVKKNMKKNKRYIITCQKLFDAHKLRNICDCSNVVVNLKDGLLVWTHVEFECGERIKINCHCLEIV